MTGAPHELTFPKLSPGLYGVNLEGYETDLRVVKDAAAARAWGAPQEWLVVLKDGPDLEHLFTAKGLDDAKRVLRVMANQLRS